MRSLIPLALASVAGGMEMEVAGAAVDDCNGTICDLTSGTTGWAGDKDTSNFVLDNRPMGKDTFGHAAWSYIHTMTAYLPMVDGGVVNETTQDYEITAGAKTSYIHTISELKNSYGTLAGRNTMTSLETTTPELAQKLDAVVTRHDAILFSWTLHNLVSDSLALTTPVFATDKCDALGHTTHWPTWKSDYFGGSDLTHTDQAHCIEEQYGIRWNWEEYNACRVSAWSEWTLCDPCQEGSSRSRARSVRRQAQNGGRECPETYQSVACDTGVGFCPPEDCLVGNWTAWGTCDKECGGGKKTRTRAIERMPRHGGNLCPALNDEVACNTDLCICSHVTCTYKRHLNQTGQGRIRVHHDALEQEGDRHLCKFEYDVDACVCRCRDRTQPESDDFAARQVNTVSNGSKGALFFHYNMADYEAGINHVVPTGRTTDDWRALWKHAFSDHWR